MHTRVCAHTHAQHAVYRVSNRVESRGEGGVWTCKSDDPTTTNKKKAKTTWASTPGARGHDKSEHRHVSALGRMHRLDPATHYLFPFYPLAPHASTHSKMHARSHTTQGAVCRRGGGRSGYRAHGELLLLLRSCAGRKWHAGGGGRISDAVHAIHTTHHGCGERRNRPRRRTPSRGCDGGTSGTRCAGVMQYGSRHARVPGRGRVGAVQSLTLPRLLMFESNLSLFCLSDPRLEPDISATGRSSPGPPTWKMEKGVLGTLCQEPYSTVTHEPWRELSGTGGGRTCSQGEPRWRLPCS